MAEAAARGFTVYRYPTFIQGTPWVSRIVYALHPSDADVEPEVPGLCTGPRCVLTTHEGYTPRCQAYKELFKLLAEVQALPIIELEEEDI